MTVKISQGMGKRPGFFTAADSVRAIADESEAELAELGRQGWELVSIILLDLGTFESGPSSAAAFLKRPIE